MNPAMAVGPGMERLDFTLPEFTRISWVSDRARDVWHPRLSLITNAWLEIEWLSVSAGLRACAVTCLPAESLAVREREWAELGLESLLPAGEAETGYRVVGRRPDLADFQGAYDAGDAEAVGRLLGSPPCCHAFFRGVWVEEELEDPTWPMARASVSAPPETRCIEVAAPPQTNLLWRWMGARPVPHLPCRFDCPHTVELAGRFEDVGRRAGFGSEMDWLLEVLDWPVEWSALHGIAEIKTPVLKVSTRTDATARKYVVRRLGNAYPAEGAAGLKFPYRLDRQPVLTTSIGFRRGINNPIPVSQTKNGTAAKPIAGPGTAKTSLRGPTRPTSPGATRPLILDETLRSLQDRGHVAGQAIRSIHLNKYFTVVGLNDGSVGACMSYYGIALPLLGEIRAEIGALLADDPLLLRLLFGEGGPSRRWAFLGDQQAALVGSLRAAVVSALSAPCIRAGGDDTFQVTDSPPFDLFADVRQALVIGCGGHLQGLARTPHVSEIHVRDLAYLAYRDKMDPVIEVQRLRHPTKTITLASGDDTSRLLRKVDFVSITGSALCNGTLEGLLYEAQGVRTVVVQGQSASIHPKALFDRGVHLVETTLKPPELLDLADKDSHGDAMRPLLEAGLEVVYLSPR